METSGHFDEIKDGVLADIDNYIANKCKNPDAPYYAADADGVYLNIRQIREEIARGTTLGREAAESWKGMRDLEKKEEMHKNS